MSQVLNSRPTRALISLGNLAFNLRSARAFIGEGVMVMAVVKANAYGHGAVECSRRLVAEGVDWLAVATPEEALELRSAGLTTPILSLGGFWSGQEEMLLDQAITPVIFRAEQATMLDAAAERQGRLAAIHIKIDTGMGRLGVRPERAAELASLLRNLKNLKVEGLMTHFAVADEPDNDFTAKQIQTFEDCVKIFRAAGHKPEYLDLANSPGAVVHAQSRSNLVRLGGILYGLGGDVLPKGVPAPELKPVMRVESAISDIKDFPPGESIGYGRTFMTERQSRIATVPIGYHDGLPRALSNNGQLLIRGKKAPILGRVSMDWVIVDVTAIEGCAVNDPVTIIGRDGDESILAEDIAVQSRTISYEITCGISDRVPRIYDQGS